MLLVITTAIITLLVIGAIHFFNKRKSKPIMGDETKNPNNFVEIPTINENDVINSKIESIIHSIGVDDGWSHSITISAFSTIGENKITYTKILETKAYSTREVSLTACFQFEEKKFKIRGISINTKSGNLHYTGKLNDNEKIKIFYNTYAEHRKRENDNNLKRIDNILKDVNEAIDKSTSRDIKIDEILK